MKCVNMKKNPTENNSSMGFFYPVICCILHAVSYTHLDVYKRQGMLWGIFTNRAIVLSFGVGVILGDIPTALQCGAIAELAFMGFGVGAGGTVPPNPIGPGIIGTLMAITMSDVTPESALSLSLPFAVAIQFLQTAILSLIHIFPPTFEFHYMDGDSLGRFLSYDGYIHKHIDHMNLESMA